MLFRYTKMSDKYKKYLEQLVYIAHNRHNLDRLDNMDISKTELKQEIGKALRAAFLEPVIITDRKVKSHVLMTYEYYMDMVQKLNAMEGKQERPEAVLDTPPQG